MVNPLIRGGVFVKDPYKELVKGIENILVNQVVIRKVDYCRDNKGV